MVSLMMLPVDCYIILVYITHILSIIQHSHISIFRTESFAGIWGIDRFSSHGVFCPVSFTTISSYICTTDSYHRCQVCLTRAALG